MWRGDGWIDGVYKYGAVRFGTEAEEGKVFSVTGHQYRVQLYCQATIIGYS
jgi:hypothetical protein